MRLSPRMGWVGFAKALKREFKRDDLVDVAGALTFFGILALFPFLLFLVSLAALLIDAETANVLVEELRTVAPEAVTQIVGARLQALATGGSPELLTLSGAAAIWVAAGGIRALIRALNRVYGVRDSRPWWKVNGIALITTLIGALGSILASVIAVATPAAAVWLPAPLETAVNALRLPVAGLLMMFVWACLYYFLPDVEQRFRFITPGSVTGVVIWLVASVGFSVYVANFANYDVNYGALAGVIVLLVWMYLSSMVLLLGAEINAVFEHVSDEGKKVGAKRMEDAGPDLPKAEKEEGPAPS